MRSWFAGWTKTFNCDFVFYIPRRWKEVGEQSTLWTNLNLGFYVYKEGRGKEGWEVDEEGRVDGASGRIVDVTGRRCATLWTSVGGLGS